MKKIDEESTTKMMIKSYNKNGINGNSGFGGAVNNS